MYDIHVRVSASKKRTEFCEPRAAAAAATKSLSKSRRLCRRRQYGSSKSQPCICGRLHFQTLASLKNFYILSLGPLRRDYTPSCVCVTHTHDMCVHTTQIANITCKSAKEPIPHIPR